MIFQILETIFTPSHPISSRYGYLDQSIALRNRSIRCQKDWAEHIHQCKTEFESIVKIIPQKNHVVVLGSGNLIELPLKLLKANFKKVTLVDIQHPLKIHWLAFQKKVQLITIDLTETIAHLDSFREPGLFLKWLETKPVSFQIPDADLVISANILSQLPLAAITYFEKTNSTLLPEESKNEISKLYLSQHLDWLKRGPPAWLFSDRKVIYCDPTERIISEHSIDLDFSGFNNRKSWNWALAPHGEASPNYSIHMEVHSIFKETSSCSTNT